MIQKRFAFQNGTTFGSSNAEYRQFVNSNSKRCSYWPDQGILCHFEIRIVFESLPSTNSTEITFILRHSSDYTKKKTIAFRLVDLLIYTSIRFFFEVNGV